MPTSIRTVGSFLARAIAIVTLSLASVASSLTVNPATTYTRDFLSPSYTIDRIYKSMQGPQKVESSVVMREGPQELLWITGYRSHVVDAQTLQPLSQDFMCHSNLDIDMKRHRELFDWDKNSSRRLFTLSQGQSEIRFPAGFGIPISSAEEFSLATQALNLNIGDRTFDVRVKVEVDYLRDSELTTAMKPLFMKAANGLVLVEGENGFYNVENPFAEKHGPGCLSGEGISKRYREDRYGRKFSGHWVVKPGREVNRTLVTNWMNLPFDTTVHYIAVHLHPYAESLELRDLTVNKAVFKSKVRPSNGKIGIEEVEYFTSEEGIEVFADHQYELVSTYHNTTLEDMDSMAVMYLYLLDSELESKGLPQLASAN
jgi:hypothetical protein